MAIVAEMGRDLFTTTTMTARDKNEVWLANQCEPSIKRWIFGSNIPRVGPKCKQDTAQKPVLKASIGALGWLKD